jgi:hypothetical protein
LVHQRIRAEEKARREFESEAYELQKDLGLRVPVRHLKVRVRLLEVLVEQTGGTVLTEHYRVLLADLSKAVALRAETRRSGSLHVVRA